MMIPITAPTDVRTDRLDGKGRISVDSRRAGDEVTVRIVEQESVEITRDEYVDAGDGDVFDEFEREIGEYGRVSVDFARSGERVVVVDEGGRLTVVLL
jgi:hypothetical protein